MLKFHAVGNQKYTSHNLNEYKSFPGLDENYDEAFSHLSSFLFRYGLNEDTVFLDVGCGPMRMGRLLIPLLRPRHYCGLDPAADMVEIGLEEEIEKPYGKAFLRHKSPRFSHNSDFDLSVFDEKFDMILASQVFIHCGPEQLKVFLVSAKENLAYDGQVFLDIREDRFCVTPKKTWYNWCYEGASDQWVTYPRKMFKSIVSEHGFKARRINAVFWSLVLR